jgi:hypothetical protein
LLLLLDADMRCWHVLLLLLLLLGWLQLRLQHARAQHTQAADSLTGLLLAMLLRLRRRFLLHSYLLPLAAVHTSHVLLLLLLLLLLPAGVLWARLRCNRLLLLPRSMLLLLPRGKLLLLLLLPKWGPHTSYRSSC